jgi:hypothetical protein
MSEWHERRYRVYAGNNATILVVAVSNLRAALIAADAQLFGSDPVPNVRIRDSLVGEWLSDDLIAAVRADLSRNDQEIQ